VIETKTKGGSRSTRGGTGGAQETIPEVNISDEVKTFESFLSHCHFILHSCNSKTTVKLQSHDCHPNTRNSSALNIVSAWTKVVYIPTPFILPLTSNLLAVEATVPMPTSPAPLISKRVA
jgi:hypothetical protein